MSTTPKPQPPEKHWACNLYRAAVQRGSKGQACIKHRSLDSHSLPENVQASSSWRGCLIFSKQRLLNLTPVLPFLLADPSRKGNSPWHPSLFDFVPQQTFFRWLRVTAHLLCKAAPNWSRFSSSSALNFTTLGMVANNCFLFLQRPTNEQNQTQNSLRKAVTRGLDLKKGVGSVGKRGVFSCFDITAPTPPPPPPPRKQFLVGALVWREFCVFCFAFWGEGGGLEARTNSQIHWTEHGGLANPIFHNRCSETTTKGATFITKGKD